MGQQRHFDRVRGLVSGQSGVPEAEITLETRLVEDLGMDGDDGDELLAAFADEFSADMRGMVGLNYFGHEGSFLPLLSLVPAVSLASPGFRAYVRRATRGRRALTVRSLVASARAGRWISPDQRPAREYDHAGGLYWLLIVIVLAIPLWLGPLGAGYSLLAAGFGALLVWVGLGFGFLHDLELLKRLDAAATHGEDATTAAD